MVSPGMLDDMVSAGGSAMAPDGQTWDGPAIHLDVEPLDAATSRGARNIPLRARAASQ